MKNKKSLVATQVLIFLVIGAFVFLVLAHIVPNLLGKSGAETSDFLDSSGDYDNDGIANYFDKCKCVPGETNSGCPPIVKDPDASDHCQYKKCDRDLVPKWAQNSGCPN